MIHWQLAIYHSLQISVNVLQSCLEPFERRQLRVHALCQRAHCGILNVAQQVLYTNLLCLLRANLARQMQK